MIPRLWKICGITVQFPRRVLFRRNPGFSRQEVFTMSLVCALLFLLTGEPGIAGQSSPRKIPPAPETKVEAVEEILHGVKVADPYRWLEDQQSPATRAWIDEQNRHTDELLRRFPGRDRISRRLGELMKVDSIGLPTARGSRYFFTKQEARRDLPVICLREGRDGEDEILIDPHQLSRDGSKTVSLLDVSHDGKLLAYGIRIGGEDELEVHFFDADKRIDTADVLERGRYFGVSLSVDRQTLFYARHGREGSRVFRRGLGASAEKETLIFGEGYDAGVGISPGLSEDGRVPVDQRVVRLGGAKDRNSCPGSLREEPDCTNRQRHRGPLQRGSRR